MFIVYTGVRIECSKRRDSQRSLLNQKKTKKIGLYIIRYSFFRVDTLDNILYFHRNKYISLVVTTHNIFELFAFLFQKKHPSQIRLNFKYQCNFKPGSENADFHSSFFIMIRPKCIHFKVLVIKNKKKKTYKCCVLKSTWDITTVSPLLFR